jgi:predicted methyltransferase
MASRARSMRRFNSSTSRLTVQCYATRGELRPPASGNGDARAIQMDAMAMLRRWLYAGGTRRDRLRDPDGVVAALGIGPGDIVGDLGPGVGHFTLRMARAAGPDGVVYAIDADRAGLEELSRAAVEQGLANLRTVPVARDRLEIPEPVDLLFVSATYHHLRSPAEYFAAGRSYLRPGGRVAILESRRQGLLAHWKGRHATSPRRIRSQMKQAGFVLMATHDVVAGYWFGVFRMRS